MRQQKFLKTLLLVNFLSAANSHSTELRFEFKQQKNPATTRQTEGLGFVFEI